MSYVAYNIFCFLSIGEEWYLFLSVSAFLFVLEMYN